MFLLKLAISNMRMHKIRFALTMTAIALSCCLVVAVTSGYSSAYAAAQRMLATYMGTTDAEITRHNEMRGLMSEDLLAQIEKDPDVERADGRLETSSRLLMADGAPVMTRPSQIIGIQRPNDTRVETLRMEDGKWFDSSNTEEAVVDQVAAQRLNVKIGGYFLMPEVDRQLKLRVVGIVHKPGILATAVQTIYVPLQTLQKFMLPADQRQITRILVDLKPHADESAFVSALADEICGNRCEHANSSLQRKSKRDGQKFAGIARGEFGRSGGVIAGGDVHCFFDVVDGSCRATTHARDAPRDRRVQIATWKARHFRRVDVDGGRARGRCAGWNHLRENFGVEV